MDSVSKRLLNVPALTDIFLSSSKVPVRASSPEAVFFTLEWVCLCHSEMGWWKSGGMWDLYV